ncbi:MAG: methyltransferase [Pseudomonadota bacterium]
MDKPEAASASVSSPDTPADVTLDGFLDNQFAVYQPAKGAHRSGLDAVLLAGTVLASFDGALCDLGAGAGVAGLAVLQRTRASTAHLVENDPLMVDLLRESLSLDLNLEMNEALAGRAKVLEADIKLSGAARQAAQLVDNAFDHVITNPPYNDATHQRSDVPRKAQAHHADPDLFEAWFKTACGILKPGGRLSVIVRPNSLLMLLKALENRFGSLRILPLYPRAGQDAARILVGATRGGKAPVTLLPPVTLHKEDGSFTPMIEEVLRGRCGIALWH